MALGRKSKAQRLGQEHAQEQVVGEAAVGGKPASNQRLKRALWGLALLVVLVVAYFILSATIPRWWSQRMGDLIHGHLALGALLGVVFGLLCTLLPLVILWFGLRKRRSWKARVAWVVFALVVALPNLMTLSVVTGDGSGAHAGQRVMDVNAPWFRGGTLAGVIAAAVLFVVVMVLWIRRRRRKRRGTAASAPRMANDQVRHD
jgi:glucan phosphoethanolaminetransferase (alkaline phosphatase superfamily)